MNENKTVFPVCTKNIVHPRIYLRKFENSKQCGNKILNVMSFLPLKDKVTAGKSPALHCAEFRNMLREENDFGCYPLSRVFVKCEIATECFFIKGTVQRDGFG